MPQVVNKQLIATKAFVGLWVFLSLCGCQSLHGNKNEVIVVDPSTLDGGSGAFELATQLNEQGIHFVLKEQLEKAKRKFEEAIRIAPDFGPAYNNLGLVFFHEHNFFEASRAFEAASEKSPDSAEPLNNQGLVMDSVSRPHDAMELYRQAYELEPTNAEYLGNLLRTKVRMGLIDDELRAQLHSMLMIEKRIEWQDWAREQLALLHNPELDRGPARPSSDLLNELTDRKDSSKLFYESKSKTSSTPNSSSPPGSSSAPNSSSMPNSSSSLNFDQNSSSPPDTSRSPQRMPAAIPEELPSLEPLRLPSPVVPPATEVPLNVPPAAGQPSMFPTSLPSSTRRNASILEVLE